mgnify:CR=1 FL=1|jgi:hypothetical protein
MFKHDMKFEFGISNVLQTDNLFYISPSLSVVMEPDLDAVESVIVILSFLAWEMALSITP